VIFIGSKQANEVSRDGEQHKAADGNQAQHLQIRTWLQRNEITNRRTVEADEGE